jgi:hypothetical protein
MGLNISLSLERERYIGLLFMDRFGRLFDLDAMNSLLWLRGDYSKIAEREAKGLTNNWGASWITVESKGIVVEAKSSMCEFCTYFFFIYISSIFIISISSRYTI